ncbi:MAG: PstS family phosphate ABC transporter substrate-binding protein [Candidatus Sumerlaeia bacterium]
MHTEWKLRIGCVLWLTILMVAGTVAPAQEKVVKVDGSSTVYPVTEAVAEEFQIAQKGAVKVTVGISGTGGGFKKFTRGEIDLTNASRPILTSELEAARRNGIKFIELPVCFDALTVMVNPQNDWVDFLTVEELKKVWSPEAQGNVMNWNQIRPSFPDRPLTLYGAGADSGTFDYFTEAIVGKAKSSRGDFTASEDDNVLVQGISNDRNALGYFGYAYYAENKDKLKAVPIKHGDSAPVLPSAETVLRGTYQPLSRPLFIYVNSASLENKPEVREFVEFYLKNAADLAKEVGYVPLPADAYEKGLKRLESRQTGSAFGGHAEVGLHLDELFQRELKQ